MALTFPTDSDPGADLVILLEALKANQATVITKTYNTPGTTIANATAADVASTPSALASYGYTQAQADALIASHNELVADVAVLRGVVVTLVQALEAIGALG